MPVYKNYLLPAFLGLMILVTSCSSSEIGESKDVNPETIYQDYTVTYDEADNDPQVKIWSQFRFAGSNGTTLVLTKPSSIAFDGQNIKVDSSEYTGAYYSIHLPARSFVGKHRFVFTDINQTRLENEFSLDELKLNFPASISKQDSLNISFDAGLLAADDYIEIFTAGTDSTFTITHAASENGNMLTIPASELKRQKGNKLSLVASVMKKIALTQATKEGGQIVIYHSLRPVTISLSE